ncbi:two-component sensor histidine kinase [Kushneria pakistanensis]|uniref:histidine kinase n=1 Tax=Kushneria pakistanensis TaxID=1508770 RepID=A0ABQ3FPQ4_9GAMM|nr:ATP-binding protein [Kushneria pakistanensis]GHC32933.1 two-component sensor histidine kinase [Kushneria pakistanensis]
MPRILIRLFLILLISYGAASYAVPWLVINLFKHRLESYGVAQYQGILYLLEDRLADLTPKERSEQMPELAARFPAERLRMLPIDTSDIGAHERHKLMRGKPLVTLDADGLPEKVRLYIGDGQLLEISMDALPLDIDLIYWLTNLLIGAILMGGVFLWWRPHWQDLERLKATARRLGQGHLDARTEIPAHSNLGELAGVFDGMADELEGLLARQRDLINAVSHELRTPLSRLDFGLALVADTPMTPEAARRIDEMKTHINELNALVQELLSYTRLQSPRQHLEKTTLTIEAYLDSVLSAFAEPLEERHINLEVHIEAGTPVTLEPRLTARALQNLISNAMRYCRQHIRITATHRDGMLCIQVEDDGIGIPDDEKANIFTPFYRLDRSRDRATGGFGLGLAISREAITVQDGSLTIEDAPLGGAGFQIRLPQPQ